DEIPGTVKFLFQPAEEGAPEGEEGGAALMVKEGALENPNADAVFGLHVTSRYPVGEIAYRSGAELAAVDSFKITVHGKQTHGAYPWLGIDPIVVASQIVLGLQTIPSRQLDAALTEKMVPTLKKLTADVITVNPTLGAEDFSFYQQKVPGLFIWLGTRPKNQTAEEAASNHSPLFFVDESGLVLGVRALSHLAVDYLRAH